MIALRERSPRYRGGEPAAGVDASTEPRVAARAGAGRREHPPEWEVLALWLLGRVPAELLPRPLLRAGRAGRGAGPDVREATLLAKSGVPLTGDVEVHVRASDFVRHGHLVDPAYARVVLHLVWEDDRPVAARGGAQPLPGGGSAPTVAVAPALDGSTARLRALLRQGPVGAEPCAGAGERLGEPLLRERLRAEGRRRLAERTWRAARLVDGIGWTAAWRELLVRALRSSAGRRGAAYVEALADRVSAAVSRDTGNEPLAALRALALERAQAGTGSRALIAALRGGGANGDCALGRQRAAEVGWNAALPLLATLAAAYDDVELARATAALAAAWPAPRPYGRTRALAGLLGTGAGGALGAQGLLHVQELWCERGGCGVCPFS